MLNSLAGNALRETWDCLAHFGRFIEIGKRDITTNTRLEMARFEHNAMFASVDLTVVALERPKMMKRILNDVFELLSKKEIRPISPITIFPISEVEQAFRTLQGGKIMGKIVVTAGPQDQVKVCNPYFVAAVSMMIRAVMIIYPDRLQSLSILWLQYSNYS